MIARLFALAYGGACYAVFFAVFLYAVGFIGRFFTPTMLDGDPTRPPMQALLVDIGLLVAFGLQHSGMARPAFKRWWTRVVPEWAERSTYVLASSLALAAWFALWEPIGGVVWNAGDGLAQKVVLKVYFLGWMLLLYATFVIDHFDLFGLAQVWRRWRGGAYQPPQFHAQGLYARVRHPIYVGWLLIMWAAPFMTVGHLVFALGSTAYILIGIALEERDLVAAFGARYVEYRRRTPMLVPRIRASRDDAAKAKTPVSVQ
jgi:protein-S-isoprenylcysteine O-methyltransferase Ste14